MNFLRIFLLLSFVLFGLPGNAFEGFDECAVFKETVKNEIPKLDFQVPWQTEESFGLTFDYGVEEDDGNKLWYLDVDKIYPKTREEYEEYDCTANETYFYDGLEYGNYSREYNSLNITVDIDTNCDQDTLPVMLYYDIGHTKVEDNETVWNGYMYNNYFFNVTGWEGNEYQLTSSIDYFTEPYFSPSRRNFSLTCL